MNHHHTNVRTSGRLSRSRIRQRVGVLVRLGRLLLSGVDTGLDRVRAFRGCGHACIRTRTVCSNARESTSRGAPLEAPDLARLLAGVRGQSVARALELLVPPAVLAHELDKRTAARALSEVFHSRHHATLVPAAAGAARVELTATGDSRHLRVTR